jgi:hypothetical protein
MNGYAAFPKGYPQPPYSNNNARPMVDDTLNFDMPGDTSMTLEQIVAQNNLDNEKENRRRSMPVYTAAPPMQHPVASPERRMSMMNFGDANDFQFDMSATPMPQVMRASTFPQQSADMPSDQLPANDLAINTHFSTANSPFGNIPAYASPMHPNASVDMDMASPYMNDSLILGPDMSLFSNPQYPGNVIESSVTQDFTSPLPPPQQDGTLPMPPPDQYTSASSSATPDGRSKATTRAGSQDQNSMRSNSRPQSENLSSSSQTMPTQITNASVRNQESVPLSANQTVNTFSQLNFPWTEPSGGFPSTKNSNPHIKTQFKNAYSATGFDMLGVLVCLRMAT